MTNRAWKGLILGVVALVLGVGAISAFSKSPSPPNATAVTVYKSPTCGCCAKWVDHMKENGFEVTVNDVSTIDELTAIKEKNGVPAVLGSCHTAVVGGYVVEGHVPADVVKQMLTEKPDVVGITVPGMPMGSPGMEGEYTESYDVLTFDKEGKTKVYTSR